MPRPSKQIHRPCFFRPITMLCEYFQIACQCIRTTGNVDDTFRLHKCYRVDKFFGTSASRGIHDDYVGFFTSLCHIDQETAGIIAEETDIGYLVHFGVVDGIPDCILV